MTVFPYASRLRHRVRIEVKDKPDDPTGLQVFQIDPSGVKTGPFTPTREAKGTYYYEKTYTAATPSSVVGQWDTVCIGTGVSEGSITRRHDIGATRMT